MPGYEKDSIAICPICPRGCKLKEGQVGVCGAREARRGKVVDQSYGRITSLALDPIEKKPLAAYKPGSKILSVGSYGCNLSCPFCQNASIACATESTVSWERTTPERLVEIAEDLRSKGNIGIAYTYNEPLVGFEFVRDASRLARSAGLDNVIVSNGYVSEEPLEELLPLIDAANIDLKAFTEEFYRSIGGSLDVVKRTIQKIAKSDGVHLEVTMLIVPGMNDSAEEMEQASTWLASLDESMPFHITRFFPCHKMSYADPTPVSTLRKLADIARSHLGNVMLGNV